MIQAYMDEPEFMRGLPYAPYVNILEDRANGRNALLNGQRSLNGMAFRNFMLMNSGRSHLGPNVSAHIRTGARPRPIIFLKSLLAQSKSTRCTRIFVRGFGVFQQTLTQSKAFPDRCRDSEW